MALLSMMALYHWSDKLFDRFQIPEEMDREALIAEILLQTAELEVLYADWDTMHEALGYWSRTMLAQWRRQWEALQREYNPLWNVDANILETETRDLAHGETRDKNGSSKDTSVGSGTQKSTGETITQVSAYDDTTQWANREKENSEASGNTTYKDETGRTYKDGERTDGTDTGTISRSTRRTGNIGVTSSQSLILEELEVAEHNIYTMIAEQVKKRFCLRVY